MWREPRSPVVSDDVQPWYADVVVRLCEGGGLFTSGMGELDPGDPISFFNTADESPAFLGTVEVPDPQGFARLKSMNPPIDRYKTGYRWWGRRNRLGTFCIGRYCR